MDMSNAKRWVAEIESLRDIVTLTESNDVSYMASRARFNIRSIQDSLKYSRELEQRSVSLNNWIRKMENR